MDVEVEVQVEAGGGGERRMGRCGVETHRLLLEARVVVLDHREQRVHRERHAVQVARDRVLREVGLDARPPVESHRREHDGR